MGPSVRTTGSLFVLVLLCGACAGQSVADTATEAARAPVSQATPSASAPPADAAAYLGRDSVGGIPLSFLTRPIALRGDVGPIHDPATTDDPIAQAFYDQGLAYHYGYHSVNAVRSFHMALSRDPGLALAYVGLSRAYMGHGLRDREAAAAALEAAEARVEGLPPRERLRIELRRRAMDARGDEARAEEYRATLDQAANDWPEDVELQMLRALNARGEERISRLHEVLDLAPDHTGAHHEIVHAYEVAHETEPAVRHGEKLARLASGIPHARHMYGHNLMRAGRVADAVREFSAADLLERIYFSEEAIPEAFDWHHAHNLHLLALSHWHQGDFASAIQLLRLRASLRTAHGDPRPNLRPALIEMLLRTDQPEAALAEARKLLGSEPESGPAIHGQVFQAEALLMLDRAQEAADILAQVDPTDLHERSPTRTHLARVRALTRLVGQGQDEAAQALRDLSPTIREDRGPDGWIASLMQLDAATTGARAAGDEALAKFFAREMVDHDPTLALGHYQLARSLEALGETARSRQAFQRARRLWTDAGADIDRSDGISFTSEFGRGCRAMPSNC